MIRIFLIALGVASISMTASAATGTGGSTSVILQPLSVVKTADLDFGTLVAGPTAGTITVNPVSGARSRTGGTVTVGSPSTAAIFQATGLVNQLYIVALGAPPLLTNGGGGTMPVTALALDGPTIRLFPAGNVATLRVGGTLSVAANQPSGDYTGSFTITVIYL
jgi:Mat/Ecp fimbriae major subunit